MNPIKQGWQLGGYVGSRLAVAYALLAALAFYLEINADGSPAQLWQPERLWVAALVGQGWLGWVVAPPLLAVPIGLAWLAGSVAGAMTGLLAWLFTGRMLARLWGMFSFAVPPLIFHTAAELRPHLLLGEHWLNSYWFWVGLPTLISVLIGGWVGEQLSAQRSMGHYV
jgi:hypothetical protein